MWKELRENPRALMYAALMHLLLFLALILNLDWKTSHTDAGQGAVIKAEVVDSSKVQAEVAKLKQAEENKQREEAARQQKLEKDVQQAEQRRVQEEQRLQELQQKQVEEKQNLQKLETERQAKLKQQAAAEKQAQVKKQQEAKAAQQRTAEQEKKQKAAAEAKQKADDKKHKAAEEAKRKADAESALQQQLAAEEHASQLSGEKSDTVDQFKAAIRQRVQANWLRPPGVRTGLACTVVVNVIPGGDVAGVRIVESSGDPAFDRSVENAVRKAAPLPLPPDPGLFDNFRELRFVFKPET
jgi:colicin import membrane protein